MIVYCIRHTKVDSNKGICYGQTDIGLANSYPNEKRIVCEKLYDIQFDEVFCSPLSRCRILAEDLFPQQKLIFDERLKELNFGDWEMKSWDDIYNTNAGKNWMDNYLEIPCEGGESYIDFRKRVEAFILDLKKIRQKQVAIITHGGVIRLFKSVLEKKKMDEVFTTFNPEFGGIYSFELS